MKLGTLFEFTDRTPSTGSSDRYQAIGNSVAVPCVDYILCGIAYFLLKMGEEEEDVHLPR